MAIEVGSAYVSILPNLEKFGSKLSKGVQAAGSLAGDLGGKAAGTSFSKGFLKFGAIAGVAGTLASKAVNAITSSLDSAIARVDTMNNFPLVMANMGISAEESAAAIDKISDGINGLPTSLDAATMSVQRFASVNGDVGKSADMFLAVNDAILAGGANSQIQASALEQLSQAYSKGRMDMMEWRTLQMAMPAQLNQIAQAMGMTTDALGEGLRTGEVSMDDFIDTITRLDKEGLEGFASFSEQAQAATGGIGTALTNVQNRISKALATIIDAIGQTNISGAINALSSSFAAIAQPIADFITAFKGAVDFEILAPAIEKVSGALSGISERANELASAFGTGAGQVFQRFLELALAVANVLQLKLQPVIDKLQPAFEKVGEAFQLFYGKIAEFLGGDGDIFAGILDVICGAIDAMVPVLMLLADGFSWLADRMRPIAEELAPLVIQAFTVIGGTIMSIIGIVGTVTTLISDGIRTVVETIGGFLSYFGIELGTAESEASTAGSNIAAGIMEPITSARDTISGIVQEIVGFFSGLGSRITSAIGSIHFPQPYVTWESLKIGDATTPISIPHVTWNAKGGYIVNAPTLFGAGEAGAEAVIPLSNQTYLRPFARAVAGEIGGSTYNVYIDGARLNDETEIKDATKAYLLNLMRLAAI